MIEKIKRLLKSRNFIWNTLAGLINAAEAVIILMVVNRTNGDFDAGIITFAFAVGNLMMTVGKFGVRNYQVTDVHNKYSFPAYFTTRVISAGLMAAASIIYVVYCYLTKDYTPYKCIAILLICLVYLIESIEDVFWGLYQKNGRLDLGGKSFFFRWVIHLLVICVMLVLTKNVVLSLSLGIAAGTVYAIIVNIIWVKKYYTGSLFTKVGIWGILKACFPLFLVAFFTNYVSNCPKYAIDRYMSDAMQACYGYIAMPVFVISLLNSFIYQPGLVELAKSWDEKNYKRYVSKILKQIAVVIALTVAVFGAGYFLGIPILSWLYATDLAPYKNEFLLLLLAGGLLALSGYFCVLMTVMRIQIWTMIGYIGVSVAAYFLTRFFVKNMGLMGAALIYLILMGVLSVLFVMVIILKLEHSKRLAKA